MSEANLEGVNFLDTDFGYFDLLTFPQPKVRLNGANLAKVKNLTVKQLAGVVEFNENTQFAEHIDLKLLARRIKHINEEIPGHDVVLSNELDILSGLHRPDDNDD